MTTTLTGVKISPVNMEDRKKLGLKSGDTVRVHQKIQDKDKTRIQVFEGLVLNRKHGDEPGATFTVRKVSSGVGVERIYPLYSPAIDKIEITKRAKVRRSKLYYIREKVARQVKRQMRRMNLTSIATESEAEAAARAEAEAKAVEEAEQAAVEEAKKAEEAKAAEETKVVETAEAETKEEERVEPEADKKKDAAPAEEKAEDEKREDKPAEEVPAAEEKVEAKEEETDDKKN